MMNLIDWQTVKYSAGFEERSMPRPRLRFTIRQMMIAVAIIAMGLCTYPFFEGLFSGEGPFHAIRQSVKSWDCRPGTSVRLEVREGSIEVLPSADGRITAEVMTISITSRSQRVADRALETIEVITTQAGDSIEILAGGAASVPGPEWLGYLTNLAHVVLHVPEGVRLDLSVSKGQINAGGVVNLDGRWRGHFVAGTIHSGAHVR
jgi:hypothetical protein